jgi:pyruvate dehydrogenase E2 component (dihydrolipoamide acetyltransferase)
MAATLCADHRIIDGAYAAQFMGELKRILESPATLLL